MKNMAVMLFRAKILELPNRRSGLTLYNRKGNLLSSSEHASRPAALRTLKGGGLIMITDSLAAKIGGQELLRSPGDERGGDYYIVPYRLEWHAGSAGKTVGILETLNGDTLFEFEGKTQAEAEKNLFGYQIVKGELAREVAVVAGISTEDSADTTEVM